MPDLSPVTSWDADWIRRRALEVAGIRLTAQPRVVRDTSNYLAIDRGDVLDLGGEPYLVCGHEHEGRFGIDEQPKYWVKRAVSLRTGRVHVVKLVFEESFDTTIDGEWIACTRSPEKEARVLEVVRGHPCFMQGKGVRDARGNLVRIVDFVEGDTVMRYLGDLPETHEEYVRRDLPRVLADVLESIDAIAYLHGLGLCHGDIRNDHLVLDASTGKPRWIDFDYDRSSLIFDVWCVGNVLNCVMAKGFVTFHALRRLQPEVFSRVGHGDASVVFGHRLMNLGVLYPHLPEPLLRILDRFSVGGTQRYRRVEEIVAALESAMDALGWPRRRRAGPD